MTDIDNLTTKRAIKSFVSENPEELEVNLGEGREKAVPLLPRDTYTVEAKEQSQDYLEFKATQLALTELLQCNLDKLSIIDRYSFAARLEPVANCLAFKSDSLVKLPDEYKYETSQMLMEVINPNMMEAQTGLDIKRLHSLASFFDSHPQESFEFDYNDRNNMHDNEIYDLAYKYRRKVIDRFELGNTLIDSHFDHETISGLITLSKDLKSNTVRRLVASGIKLSPQNNLDEKTTLAITLIKSLTTNGNSSCMSALRQYFRDVATTVTAVKALKG